MKGEAMSVLAQCPICRRKQKTKNKKCIECGEELDQAKRSRKVKYWIAYRISGKLKIELIGTSISVSHDAEGKRKGQKREGIKIFALKNDKLTFKELTEWYLNLRNIN